jgi:hypothetical protein
MIPPRSIRSPAEDDIRDAPALKWLISLESLPRPTATFSFDRRGYEELDRRDADRKRDPSESLDRDVQPVLDALVVGESHAQALCDLRLGKIRGGS